MPTTITLQDIFTEIKLLHTRIDTIELNMVTKEDAKKFLTKDDAKNFLTKEDAKNFLTKDDAKNFATKDDLANFATKDDLANFATKDDLANFATKDDFQELKTEIKQLSKKVDKNYRRHRQDLNSALDYLDKRILKNSHRIDFLAQAVHVQFPPEL